MRTGYRVGLFLACALSVNAGGVPYAFNYQGVLRGGSSELLDAGPRRVAFRLYDAAGGANPLWGREYMLQLETNGLFNVELSDSGAVLSDLPVVTTTPAPSLSQVVASNPALYLGLTVQGSSEIVPRQQLLSVPYAMIAGDVKSASGDFTVAGELSAHSGVQVIGNVEASNVTVGDASKNVTLSASAAGCLQVQNLNVPGSATLGGNAAVGGKATVGELTVAGTTILSGSVQAFSTKTISGSEIVRTFTNESKNEQSLLDAAASDGFLVLSIHWLVDTDGDENANKVYGDFTFKLGSDTRKLRYGQYTKDMDANIFRRYDVITLPVRKGETVKFVPDDGEYWHTDKNDFTVEMKGSFVPFGVSL